MANRVPAVDNSSYQLPPDVRRRVALNLADPATPEGEAVASQVVNKKNWADWDGTGWITHRNGGATPYMVPHTVDAIEANLASGATIIESDVRWTGGDATLGGPHIGTLWNLHDDTLTTTHDVSSSLKYTSDATVANSRILASKTTGGKYRDGAPMSFAELIDRYAPRALIVTEPKNQTLDEDWEKSMTLMKSVLDARPGAVDNVLVELDAANVAQNVPITQAVVPGVRWSTYVTSGSPKMNDLAFAADCVNLGIFAVSVDDNASQAFIDVFTNGGAKVIGFATRRTQLATFAGLGVTAFRGDYSMYVNGAMSTAKQDTFRDGFWGVGDIPATGHTRPVLETDRLRFDTYVSNRQTILLGEFAPLPATFTIDMELEYTTVGGGPVGMVALLLCAQTDVSQTGASWSVGSTGYKCGVWVAGGARVYKYDTGSEVTAATATTPAITAGATYYVRVQVTGTQVITSLRDSGGVLVGTAATATDSTWRGGFAHLMVQGETSSVHKVKKITLT